jgi:hypothetical protein
VTVRKVDQHVCLLVVLTPQVHQQGQQRVHHGHWLLAGLQLLKDLYLAHEVLSSIGAHKMLRIFQIRQFLNTLSDRTILALRLKQSHLLYKPNNKLFDDVDDEHDKVEINESDKVLTRVDVDAQDEQNHLKILSNG